MALFIYSQVGIRGVVLVDVATYAASALLINQIVTNALPERDPSAPTGGSIWTRMLGEWRAGLGIVGRNQSLRILFVSSSLASAAEGVFLTLGLTPLVLDVLGGTPVQVGWMGTAQAVGGLIASVIIVRIGHRLTKRWLLGGGLVDVGIAAPGTGAVSVAMGFMVIGGPPAVAGGAGRQSIVEEQASDAYRGRVFGALSSIQGVSMLIGFAAGGVLGDMVGLVPILSTAALIRIVGGLIAFAFLPREATHQQQMATNSPATLDSD